jgi:hypothetical protein
VLNPHPRTAEGHQISSGPPRSSRSLFESLDEPSRSNYFCSEVLSPLPQLAIRCDQRDLIRRIRSQVN